jgi:CelD/BcsL family acetyltransferase involved in cellulose biosynthesis
VRRSSFHEDASLQKDWDSLSSRTKGDFFGTFDWCETWWRHYGRGRTLRLYAFYEGGLLIGVVPLFWETLWWGPFSIRALRLVGSDFVVTTASFVVEQQHIERVARLLAAELASSKDWDVAQLGELPGYNENCRPFADTLIHADWSLEFRNDNYPHMVLDIPHTFGDYLVSLKANERNNIRKREERLKGRHRIAFDLATEEDVADRFEEFARQHQDQWQAGGKLGHFVDWDGSLEFHREMASKQVALDRLMLMRVSADGETIGYQYCYVYNGRVHFIISSRDLAARWEYYSLGRLLHCAVIRAAIERKATMLDSLGGYFDHKRRLGARVVGLQTITLRRKTLSAAWRRFLFVAATRLVDGVYHRMWYWHLAPYLRRRFKDRGPGFLRRGLWPRFVRTRFLVAAEPESVACERNGAE